MSEGQRAEKPQRHPHQRPTVLITGATSGFGLATAKKFTQHGYPLVITGRRKEHLQDLSDQLSPLTDVLFYHLHVRDSDAVKTFTQAILHNFKQVTILVNNADLALGSESADKASLDDWHIMIDTNVTYCLLPLLRNQASASIINLAENLYFVRLKAKALTRYSQDWTLITPKAEVTFTLVLGAYYHPCRSPNNL